MTTPLTCAHAAHAHRTRTCAQPNVRPRTHARIPKGDVRACAPGQPYESAQLHRWIGGPTMPATVRITGRTLLLVRAATDLVDLIGETVSLTREPDGRYRGRCSLQQPEESHDFEVRRRPDMDAWYCSTCGRGGDLVTWVMDRRGLGFEGAVRYLAERAGIPVGYEPMPAGPQRVQR